MKHFYLIALNFFVILSIQSQNCLPDSIYRDSSAGVYPKPVSPTNPSGGITKKACINKPYEFVFTVVVPDTVLVPAFPSPIALEKVAIDTINAITGLPKGISYACNPPNCVFNKNTSGCLVLKGTATTDNTVGDFKPIIKMTLTINLGIPFPYVTEYPGPAFPGEYILTLVSEQDCASASKQEDLVINYWFPNPTNGKLTNKSNSIEQIKVMDAQGRIIHFTKDAENKIDLSNGYNSGMFYIQWIDGTKLLTQQIVIQ